MGTAIKVVLALVIVVFVTAVVYNKILDIKRTKLLEGWMEFAKQKKVTLPEYFIKMELKKLGNHDLNILIDFSKLLQQKNYFLAGSMYSQVLPILGRSANLTDLTILFGTIIQNKINHGGTNI